MKFLNCNKVLCLAAHPDDVEYGMLGSIMKYTDTKFDILVLSKGGILMNQLLHIDIKSVNLFGKILIIFKVVFYL